MILLVVLSLLLAACASSAPGIAKMARFEQPFIGTLQTQGPTAANESANGVKVAMLELNWAAYEPAEGRFDIGYERRVQAQMDLLTAAGMRVTLALGIHFTPAWVLALPDATFVDEHGHSSSVIDLTFNSIVRAAVVTYLQRADSALGFRNFWAVRITSGGSSELLYPNGGSYWAFDRNAQNGPQYPGGMARNPFPGWHPGDKNLDPSQVRTWYHWYVGSLAATANWQMGIIKKLGFTGYYQILTPGLGILPDDLDRAVNADLPDGVAGRGAAWDEIYQLLPHQSNIVAYVTSMADGSGKDMGCSTTDDTVPLSSPALENWSSTRWISRIADQFHLTKAGENPGYVSTASYAKKYVDRSANGMMSKAFMQARSCHFQGLYWAHDAQLWNGMIDIENLYRYTTPTAGLPPIAAR